MDAFEDLVSSLLRRRGYWTITSFKVELTKEDKQAIDRVSSPRWELDVVAYRPSENKLLIVECKSYFDSRGVDFRDGAFKASKRYKLFSDDNLRNVVVARLLQQIKEAGMVVGEPRVVLCLAAGKLAPTTDIDHMRQAFGESNWRLFDPAWIRTELESAAMRGYENDVATIATKILLRNP